MGGELADPRKVLCRIVDAKHTFTGRADYLGGEQQPAIGAKGAMTAEVPIFGGGNGADGSAGDRIEDQRETARPARECHRHAAVGTAGEAVAALRQRQLVPDPAIAIEGGQAETALLALGIQIQPLAGRGMYRQWQQGRGAKPLQG